MSSLLYVSAAFGLMSAFCWLRSALVNVPNTNGERKNISMGGSNDAIHGMATALREQAVWSKWGAVTAALTVFFQALESLKPLYNSFN